MSGPFSLDSIAVVRVREPAPDREWHAIRMRAARSSLVRSNPFLPIEHWFPEWPGLRAFVEREMPQHVSFRRSPTDPNVVEHDLTWIERTWAMSPTEEDRFAFEGRTDLILDALEPCLPSFDFKRFIAQEIRPAMNSLNYARCAEIMLTNDRECRALGYPTFMQLWSHLLGIQDASGLLTA